MKSFKKFLIATAIGAFIALPANAAATDDVKAAYEQWNAAFNNGDAAQLANSYADEAVFLPPTHEVIEGPDGIQTFFDALFQNGVTSHALEVVKIMEDGDEIVAASKWSAKGKDGTPLGGIATHVFQRQADGSLKLTLHTFN